MGSYINIGLAGGKDSLVDNFISFVNNISDFKFISVNYPEENDYNNWLCVKSGKLTLKEALEYCIKNEMAYIDSSINFNGKSIYGVDITCEKVGMDLAAFIIKIPEELLVEDLDQSEEIIIKLLMKAEGFECAFCDSEAHLEDRKYAIYVDYSGNASVSYNSWKIDGYTKR